MAGFMYTREKLLGCFPSRPSAAGQLEPTLLYEAILQVLYHIFLTVQEHEIHRLHCPQGIGIHPARDYSLGNKTLIAE